MVRYVIMLIFGIWKRGMIVDSKRLPDNETVVFQTEGERVHMEVLFEKDNLWLPQRRIAEFFGCEPEKITYHLKNIYAEHELNEETTAK